MRPTRSIAHFVLGLTAWLAFNQPVLVHATADQVGSPRSAVKLIESTSDRVLTRIAAMPIAGRNIQAIESLIAEVVLPHVDVEMISQRVFGRFWKQATPAERESLAQGLQNAVIRTYAQALLDFQGADIAYLAPRVGRKGRQVVVRSTVTTPNGADLRVHYRLKHRGAWKLIDLVVEGVSFTITYRTSLLPELRRGGIDRVVDLLSKQKSPNSSPL